MQIYPLGVSQCGTGSILMADSLKIRLIGNNKKEGLTIDDFYDAGWETVAETYYYYCWSPELRKTAWGTTTRINKSTQVSDLMKLLYISALKISIKRAQSQTRLTLTSVRNFDICFNAFALTGRMYPPSLTQGVALGYWLIGLSGRPKANP